MQIGKCNGENSAPKWWTEVWGSSSSLNIQHESQDAMFLEKKKKNTPVQPLVSSHLISYSEKPQYSTKVIKLWLMDAPSGLWAHIHTSNVSLGMLCFLKEPA